MPKSKKRAKAVARVRRDRDNLRAAQGGRPPTTAPEIDRHAEKRRELQDRIEFHRNISEYFGSAARDGDVLYDDEDFFTNSPEDVELSTVLRERGWEPRIPGLSGRVVNWTWPASADQPHDLGPNEVIRTESGYEVMVDTSGLDGANEVVEFVTHSELIAHLDVIEAWRHPIHGTDRRWDDFEASPPSDAASCGLPALPVL